MRFTLMGSLVEILHRFTLYRRKKKALGTPLVFQKSAELFHLFNYSFIYLFIYLYLLHFYSLSLNFKKQNNNKNPDCNGFLNPLMINFNPKAIKQNILLVLVSSSRFGNSAGKT